MITCSIQQYLIALSAESWQFLLVHDLWRLNDCWKRQRIIQLITNSADPVHPRRWALRQLVAWTPQSFTAVPWEQSALGIARSVAWCKAWWLLRWYQPSMGILLLPIVDNPPKLKNELPSIDINELVISMRTIPSWYKYHTSSMGIYYTLKLSGALWLRHRTMANIGRASTQERWFLVRCLTPIQGPRGIAGI